MHINKPIYTVMKRICFIIPVIASILVPLFTGCETELGEVFRDPTNELVYSYLKIEENKDDFSILVEAMDKSGLAGMLNSYGTYTFFAPDNNGFRNYFEFKNISGLDDLDSTEIRDIIVYHVLDKIRLATDLAPGFSSDTTGNGDYLAFDFSKGGGEIYINGKARITKIDQQVSNGVVHHIDNVLDPPDFTLWNYLEGLEDHSIIINVFKETGIDELLETIELNRGKLNYTYTVFAESNSVFQEEGIDNLNQLKNKLANRDSDLKEFANYHVIGDKRLRGAIFSFMIGNESLETLKGQRINANIDNGLIFNQYYKNNKLFGIRLIEENSDIFAKNGVFHSIDGIMFLPEEQELEPIIRECEYGIVLNESTDKYEVDNDSLASWTPGTEIYLESQNTLLRYDAKQKDNYISFVFENVIPGKYNVILGYISNSAFAKVQLYIDGAPLGDVIDLTEEGDDNEVVIGPKEFTAFDDYVFKFIHVTNGDGLYDYIKLDPITD